MSRELWAKLHVELLDDEKMRRRPDHDFKLWVSLILYAKEAGDDGVVNLTAEEMGRRFWMHCGVAKIQSALDHFVASHMIELVDGGIKLLHYEKRQTVMDQHERNAERQRRWYKKHHQPNGVPNAEPNGVANGHSNSDPDARLTTEEKRLEEIRSPLSPPSGGATQSHPFRRKAEPPPPLPKWKQQGASSPEEYERQMAAAMADAVGDRHGT